jgi:hypothetical protein
VKVQVLVREKDGAGAEQVPRVLANSEAERAQVEPVVVSEARLDLARGLVAAGVGPARVERLAEVEEPEPKQEVQAPEEQQALA